jgi:hypothetical protein
MVQIKALACELPCERGLPLSRFSHADIAREAMAEGVVTFISGTMVWRRLNADAIKPFQYRSRIFPSDPDFAEKTNRMLNLYQRIWEGKKLRQNDQKIRTDEKTSIQTRNRSGLHISAEPGRCLAYRI